MRITEIKTKTVESEEVVDVICNKCGESCKENDCTDSPGIGNVFCGLVEVSVDGGYFSPVFDDGIGYKFSVCERCLDEYFKTFKHPPSSTYYF